jgi:2-polyprenyl-3-methyl-5-hydroxy-6-metoxy-1,4-benzoquinol methylase
VLDVGCATGIFLHEMGLAGWQTAGVELVASAAELARQRFGLEVFQGMLVDAPYASASFDVLTFWDVLEHTFSPQDELKRAAELLKPGGLVVIHVPNWESIDRRLFGPYWAGLDSPRHLFVFTRPSLNALLENAGFRPLEWACCLPSYFSFVMGVERFLREHVAWLAKPIGRVLNFPGVRLIFEPWFTLTDWLGQSGNIAVFAIRK